MSTLDFVRAPARLAREHVTSRIRRSQTFHAIVQAVADEAVGEHIPFDHCCLYLPADAERQAQVWRAARSAHYHEDHARTLDELPPRLAEVIRDGRAVFLNEDELHTTTTAPFAAADVIGVRVRSALAVPLMDETNCFGALCFTSRLPHAYTTEHAAQIEWLAETVALATRATLAREHRIHLDEATIETNRFKQYFVRTLVRDVRLPLAGVLGVLKTLEGKLLAQETLTAADRHLLNAAIEHGERVCFSVDDHLEVAQDGSHKLTLEMRPVAAARLIDEAIETVRADAALHGVGIEAHVAKETPDLFIDGRQAARLLMHVLDAALAQAHEGGRIWVEAHGISGRRTEDDGRRFCRIDVTEDGAGLPIEEMPFIFDPFRPATPSPHNATNSNIGLAIARRIAVAHGGNISARSSLGVGTIYCITLPAAAEI